MPPPIARIRSRRRSRGAIFVEAIIVSAMLCMMMAGALFFHRLYAMKMKTQRESRAAAWGQALPGCNSNIALVALWQAVGVADAVTGGELDGLNNDSANAPKWLSVGRESDVKTATATAHPLVGGQTYTLRTTNSIVCNERGDDDRGDILGVLEYMWTAIIPS